MTIQAEAMPAETWECGSSTNLPIPDDFPDLVTRAASGTPNAFETLQRLVTLDPSLGKMLTDLVRRRDQRLFSSRRAYLGRKEIEETIERVRRNLVLESDGPLEAFLIHRVIATYLDLKNWQKGICAAAPEATLRRNKQLLSQATERHGRWANTLTDHRSRNASSRWVIDGHAVTF